ncbi:metal-sensitive transcriptional regulator [Candidatus Saccharibacteria bacterium]|nr:metal-sensitive transcriptional regulator [Candidatus Saccharibacteria bacterium]
MKKDTKSRSLHRIKIIKGQMEGLEKQIANEAYCMDILTQSLAIQRSLASLNKLVLEHHIEMHIQHMLASKDKTEREKAMSELSQLYELHNVRGK